MADQKTDRLEKGGTTVVVVDQQPSPGSRSKPTEQDGAKDGLHKWTKVPDISSVAAKMKDELMEENNSLEQSNQSSTNYPTKLNKEMTSHQAASTQSIISHVPDIKPFETIELTKLGPPTHPSKMESEPNVPIKRLETTFPKMESEPVVTTVVKRIEAVVKKGAQSPLPESVKRSKAAEHEIIAMESTVKVRPSQPIPLDVKSPMLQGSPRLEKTVEEKDDVVISVQDDERLSNWITTTDQLEKKEDSWEDSGYLDKVQLQVLNTEVPLVQQDIPASTSRDGMVSLKPCGFTLCLPQRSRTIFCTPRTGIHIAISKGSLVGSKSQFTISEREAIETEIPASKSAEQFSPPRCITVLREKLDIMRNKIKQYFVK